MALTDNPLLQLTGPQQHLWNDFERLFPTEDELIAAAVALGADEITPWSEQETLLARAARKAKPLTKTALSMLRDLISAGFDPLGEAFCTLRLHEDRRADGATYTPGPIVRATMDWAAAQKNPGGLPTQRGEAYNPRHDRCGSSTRPQPGRNSRKNLGRMKQLSRSARR
jgi:hypothetical protein